MLKEVKNSIAKSGEIAEYFVCDVTQQKQVNQTVDKIVETFRTVDILVNGAGIWTTDEFEEARPELIENAFKVNSIGPIYFTKAILPILRKKNNGHIFNIISKAGLDLPENKDWLTYTATKWAMTGFYPGGFESNIF